MHKRSALDEEPIAEEVEREQYPLGAIRREVQGKYMDEWIAVTRERRAREHADAE